MFTSKDDTHAALVQAFKEVLSEGRLKIDVADIVRQLASSDVHQEIRRYLTGNHRFVTMLDERARHAARSTYDFIDREMPRATFLIDQFRAMSDRVGDVAQGHILDLGVYKGTSTTKIAHMFPDRRIYGFDSFEGLPEDWSQSRKGAFGEIKGVLPVMPDNVTLVPGWFDATLPVWAKEHEGETIALLRVDCDIYSSTKTIFDTLGDKLRPGTWICFDELVGYFSWQQHEHKAFQEFIAKTGHKFEYVTYGLTYVLGKLL